jgi:hypothetical protein
MIITKYLKSKETLLQKTIKMNQNLRKIHQNNKKIKKMKVKTSKKKNFNFLKISKL